MSASAGSRGHRAQVLRWVLSAALPPAEVHVLLLDDLLLLLQRQDERLLLKSHSRTLTPTPDGKTMLRPVLRLTSAMTREVATGEAWPRRLRARLPTEWGGNASESPGTHVLAKQGLPHGLRSGRLGRRPSDWAGSGARLGCGFHFMRWETAPGFCTEEQPALSAVL